MKAITCKARRQHRRPGDTDSWKAFTYEAAQGVRASEEPARPSVAPPGRAPQAARTRAAVARSTDSTQAAEAARPGRVATTLSRTPGR
jgi:hypothetical protein